jgi:hypothetical protein
VPKAPPVLEARLILRLNANAEIAVPS